jgi:hypothetical protein
MVGARERFGSAENPQPRRYRRRHRFGASISRSAACRARSCPIARTPSNSVSERHVLNTLLVWWSMVSARGTPGAAAARAGEFAGSSEPTPQYDSDGDYLGCRCKYEGCGFCQCVETYGQCITGERRCKLHHTENTAIESSTWIEVGSLVASDHSEAWRCGTVVIANKPVVVLSSAAMEFERVSTHARATE